MTGASLVLSQIRVRRSRRTVLDIEQLRIPSGAFVGIIGANGAGKTTFLRLCAGLIQPNAGSVVLDGNDLGMLGPWGKCRLRRRIGYIPQSAQYNAELPFTLREVVAMGRTSVRPLLTGFKADDHGIVDRWIDVLGLSAQRDQTFRTLSGGEQQKTLIARAMAQHPHILMLDEPCANLDFNWKYQISEIVGRLHRQTGITVVMVSHDTSVLPPSCKRVILLAKGRILGDGTAYDVLSSDVLDRAYHGPLKAVVMAGRRHIVSRPSDSNEPDISPGDMK
jgi:iron complex transport system ATP-binding protein